MLPPFPAQANSPLQLSSLSGRIQALDHHIDVDALVAVHRPLGAGLTQQTTSVMDGHYPPIEIKHRRAGRAL